MIEQNKKDFTKDANKRTAALIKRRRQELNMSHKQLADKLNVCVQTVYRYEKEGVDVRMMAKYLNLARALDIPLQTLLGIDDCNYETVS